MFSESEFNPCFVSDLSSVVQAGLLTGDVITPDVLQGKALSADLSFKVDEGLAVAKQFLSQFAARTDFADQLKVAFGDDYDLGVAAGIGLEWAQDNFGDLPKIQVLSAEVIGSANGAFAASTNQVYLSKMFLAQANSGQVVSVILEEIGHSVDARINQFDAAGDEGDIFAHLVQNQGFADGELAALKIEDDSNFVLLNGQDIRIEQAWQQMPGNAQDIGVGANGSVWVIGSNPTGGGYGIYNWNGSGWQIVDGGATKIAVDPSGNPWVVNNGGNIFRRLNNAWQPETLNPVTKLYI